MEETVGSRLKALVIAKALRDAPGAPPPTAKQIAATLGVRYESLRKWTAGKTAPTRRRAGEIAARLECPAEAFMHGVNFGTEDDPESEAPSHSARAMRMAALFDAADPDRQAIMYSTVVALAGKAGDQAADEDDGASSAALPLVSPSSQQPGSR